MDASGDPVRDAGTMTERFTVFAAMRNEGAFIVEWVAWYRMLGFRVLIGYNDCTDHSPELLGALAHAGWVERFEHVPGALNPKASAYRAARRQPAVAEADWLLICDVDEFLVPHVGDGSIGGYLDRIGRDHQGVAFHWRCFGTGGQARYEDRLVHRTFTRCSPAADPININFKTLVRDPLRFRRLDDHAPHGFDGDWGKGNAHFVDGEGRVIERFLTQPGPVRFTGVAEISHRMAQMNHYILRWRESYDAKRGTPSASAGKDRYTDRFFRARDRNDESDLSALTLADRFDAVHAQAMALPDIRWLHHLCCADYVARLCAAAGRPFEDDPRWRFHMSEAARD